MINKVAAAFIEFQLKVGTMQQEDAKVYCYGYTLMIEVILNVIVSICLGVFLKNLKEIAFFLCMFIPLRSFSGGYHADKAWKCIILSNMAVFVTVVMSKCVIFSQIPQIIKYFIMVLCFFVVMLVSPIENQNKKLDTNERRVYKIWLLVFLVVQMIIGVVLNSLKLMVYFHIIIMTYMIHIFSLALAVRQAKHDKMRDGMTGI